jgi:hypothetical protein
MLVLSPILSFKAEAFEKWSDPHTLASKSVNRVTIFGVRVVTAAKTLAESVVSKAVEPVASLVPLVMEDSSSSTVIARVRDWKSPPV